MAATAFGDGGSTHAYLQRSEKLARAYAAQYISIAELNVATGATVVLKSDKDAALAGASLPWEKLIERYAENRAIPEDKDSVRALTLPRMAALLKGGDAGLPLEVRCRNSKGQCDWVQISATVSSLAEKTLLITTCEINETRMMRSIIDLFVYNNFDYVFLINAKDNSYTRLAGTKNGMPLPGTGGQDYTAEMENYNRRYVAPEDVERVTANMQLSHVTQMLEKTEEYSFSSGGFKRDGSYRRSRVRFSYYDKTAGLIFCARTDVTKIYLEEQAKNARLAAALRQAQHDALTGLFNQKAMAELVARSLDSQYRNLAAFLFIDVDNFKMVNDTLGHQAGDALLCHLAAFLQRLAGREGLAGRIGGDEFLLFLPLSGQVGQIGRQAEKICRLFDGAWEGKAGDLPVSCSVGISLYPQDGTDYETLTRKADQALYTSKRYGKRQHYFYSQLP